MRICGLDVLGATEARSVVDAAVASALRAAGVSPLTPEQLSKVERKLTPAEQKQVDDWQAAQADAAHAGDVATKDVTMDVTPTGATIKLTPAVAIVPAAKPAAPFPAWQMALVGAGVAAVGGGIYLWARA